MNDYVKKLRKIGAYAMLQEAHDWYYDTKVEFTLFNRYQRMCQQPMP